MIALDLERTLAVKAKENMSLGGQNKGFQRIANPEPVHSADQAAKKRGQNRIYITVLGFYLSASRMAVLGNLLRLAGGLLDYLQLL